MKKEMRVFALFFISMILIVLVLNLVSAETNFEAWGRDVGTAITTFLESIKINPDNLSVILLGVLLWIIVFSIVKQIFSYQRGKWGHIMATVISLIVVILTFIYMPENFIEAIALQYGAMGATILTVIPFAIMLYFTVSVSSSLFFARVIWIFYIIYYFTLFLYKWGTSTEPFFSFANLPYAGAILAGILIFLFLPTMRNFVYKGELDEKEEKGMKDIKFRTLGRKLEREETTSRTQI